MYIILKDSNLIDVCLQKCIIFLEFEFLYILLGLLSVQYVVILIFTIFTNFFFKVCKSAFMFSSCLIHYLHLFMF